LIQEEMLKINGKCSSYTKKSKMRESNLYILKNLLAGGKGSMQGRLARKRRLLCL